MPTETTIYVQLGGEAAIYALVNRFYELMDALPEAYTVRQLHPESLAGSATAVIIGKRVLGKQGLRKNERKNSGSF